MNYRDPQFLKNHIQDIINFYDPVCMDHEYGGYINQLLDNGTVFDRDTKHLVGTCRFIYNYSLASIALERPDYQKAASHGVRFLIDHHRQANGGYAWVLNRHTVTDGTYHCYGHAFVLLAAAGACKAGIAEADSLLDSVWDLLEKRFWDADASLYVDEITNGDWDAVSPYRGQNANMHMCEAMLVAWEASGNSRYLDRAELLAQRICRDLAGQADGLIWEHYQQDWSHDWKYNIDDPQHLFRPYGYLPGHFTEWAKLLLILNKYRPAAWLPKSAAFLFDTALEKSWDTQKQGMHYTFAPDGKILDTDRYYWVIAETFAAAALLAIETGDDKYWNWYDRVWSYADKHFIDHKYGGWYRILDQNGKKYSNEKSPASKTDYHPLAACFEVLARLDK